MTVALQYSFCEMSICVQACMVADAQLAVKQIQTDAVHNACQRQHATHAQLLSMSPQSDRRQKLMGDQGGGKQSTFAQLTTQVSTHTHTHTQRLTKRKLAPAQRVQMQVPLTLSHPHIATVAQNTLPIRCNVTWHAARVRRAQGWVRGSGASPGC